jgi:hypothetical protein
MCADVASLYAYVRLHGCFVHMSLNAQLVVCTQSCRSRHGPYSETVITNRLIRAAAEEHELLHDAQNAFRPDRSTYDHIFTLSQFVRGRILPVLPGPAKCL